MLPAFGRELLDLRRNGKRPAQPVYVTDDWQIARTLREKDRFVLVAEDWQRPYDFEALRGLDVIAIPTSLEFVARVVPLIKAARPRWARRMLSVFESFRRSPSELVADAMQLEAVAASETRRGSPANSTACA